MMIHLIQQAMWRLALTQEKGQLAHGSVPKRRAFKEHPILMAVWVKHRVSETWWKYSEIWSWYRGDAGLLLQTQSNTQRWPGHRCLNSENCFQEQSPTPSHSVRTGLSFRRLHRCCWLCWNSPCRSRCSLARPRAWSEWSVRLGGAASANWSCHVRFQSMSCNPWVCQKNKKTSIQHWPTKAIEIWDRLATQSLAICQGIGRSQGQVNDRHMFWDLIRPSCKARSKMNWGQSHQKDRPILTAHGRLKSVSPNRRSDWWGSTFDKGIWMHLVLHRS